MHNIATAESAALTRSATNGVYRRDGANAVQVIDFALAFVTFLSCSMYLGQYECMQYCDSRSNRTEMTDALNQLRDFIEHLCNIQMNISTTASRSQTTTKRTLLTTVVTAAPVVVRTPCSQQCGAEKATTENCR